MSIFARRMTFFSFYQSEHKHFHRDGISLARKKKNIVIFSVNEESKQTVQYVAQFSCGPSFRTKRTLFDYFRRSFKSSTTEEFQK